MAFFSTQLMIQEKMRRPDSGFASDFESCLDFASERRDLTPKVIYPVFRKSFCTAVATEVTDQWEQPGESE